MIDTGREDSALDDLRQMLSLQFWAGILRVMKMWMGTNDLRILTELVTSSKPNFDQPCLGTLHGQRAYHVPQSYHQRPPRILSVSSASKAHGNYMVSEPFMYPTCIMKGRPGISQRPLISQGIAMGSQEFPEIRLQI